jgi:hypothetical protein
MKINLFKNVLIWGRFSAYPPNTIFESFVSRMHTACITLFFYEACTMHVSSLVNKKMRVANKKHKEDEMN